jgi:membrane-associated phospholipid phosphatase
MRQPADLPHSISTSAPVSVPRRLRRTPEQRRYRRIRVIRRLLATALAAALLLYAAVWLYAYADGHIGPFAPLVAGLALALLVALLSPWLLTRYRAPLRAALIAISTRLRSSLRSSWPVRAFAARFPRLARFLFDRCAPAPATAFVLIVGLFAACAVVWVFVELLVQVATGSPLVGTDTRTLNLVATLRTPRLDQAMYLLTYLGSAQTIVALAALAVVIALLAGRRQDAILLVLALLAATAFFEIVKALVDRPRPPLEDARIVQSGFSFPSGHSTIAAVFYGTVAYLLMRSLRHAAPRALVGIAAGLLVIGIGVSRVYLGVHYPSDVLAGWAAGLLWVILVIVAEHVWQMGPVPRLSRQRRVVTRFVSPVLLLVTGAALAYLYPTIPAPPQPPPPSLTFVADDQLPAVAIDQLPHYTASLFGNRQEPVSLIFVGTRASLEAAFRAAGWSEAQTLTIASFGQEVAAGISQQNDPAGPVTPSFLGDEPNALAFDQTVGGTVAQRHHVRIWSTTVETTQGLPVWLATASFDEGFELAPRVFLPTHKIDPNIDAERAYLVASLQSAGAVTSTDTIQLVPAQSGHNFAGDPFFTDGDAVIVRLR